jgi:hypothetical protein
MIVGNVQNRKMLFTVCARNDGMPKTKTSPKADDKEQSKLFIETAREIGADEAKSAADELIGRLAKTPPEPRAGKKGQGPD